MSATSRRPHGERDVVRITGGDFLEMHGFIVLGYFAVAIRHPYSLASAIGGFTPFLVTRLPRRTGDPAIPGVWLSAAAVISLLATSLVRAPPAEAT